MSCPACMRTMCSMLSLPRSACIPTCCHCFAVSDFSSARLPSRAARNCATLLQRRACHNCPAGGPDVLIKQLQGDARRPQNLPHAPADNDFAVGQVAPGSPPQTICRARDLRNIPRWHAAESGARSWRMRCSSSPLRGSCGPDVSSIRRVYSCGVCSHGTASSSPESRNAPQQTKGK